MENEAENNNNPSTITSQARQLAANGWYAKAYDLYLTAFEKFPHLKTQLEPEFRLLMNKLNEVLVTSNKIGDIFYNFERAIDVFPLNVHILNDIGKHLYKFGYYIEACCHFQKALNIDCGYVAAEKNLNSVKNYLVERWHFRMLNDKVRNNAYRDAIHEAITPIKDSILDLGTGSGLLSAYASECRPMAVTAVDSSEVMTDIANSVFYENDVQSIVVVTKEINTLDYRDIGGKRSLIITEMFDAALFGEHIVKTAIHAWEYLASNVGRILPMKAEFFVVGIKSDFLNMKYQMTPTAKSLINIKNTTVHVKSVEPYDCEDVNMIKDVVYMTEPQSLVKVDFNDCDDLQKVLYRSEPYDVMIKAKETGEINMIIGWFNVQLTPKISLTTNPQSEKQAKAWQQALFYDFVPINVKKNQSIPLQFSMMDEKLLIMPDFIHNIIRVSPEIVRFLNDNKYMTTISDCIGTLCIYIGQITDIAQAKIVDLNPFPYLGLLLLKRGFHSVICYAKDREDKKFIKKVFRANRIPLSKINVLLPTQFRATAFKNQKYHIVFSNLLELSGDFNADHKEIVDIIKEDHLHQGGIVLPHKITLEAVFVNSPWLDINNRVYDENVHDYKIAMFMNKYQVSQNIHLDLEHLEYESMTEIVTVAEVTSAMTPDVLNVPIIKEGQANAILCWYAIEIMEDGAVISTKRPNAFIDGMAYLANPKIIMKLGGTANILRCVDSDGAFKLLMDSENSNNAN